MARSNDQASAQSEPGDAAGPPTLFEMKELAMRAAFRLRHGREKLADPTAYAAAERDLVAVLKERVEAFEGRLPVVEAWAEEREKERAEKGGAEGGNPAGAMRSSILYWPSLPQSDDGADPRRQEKIALSQQASDQQMALAQREMLALLDLCVASGVWGDVVDPERRDGLARACALHESQLELRLTPTKLENLKERYAVTAAKSEDGGVELKAERSGVDMAGMGLTGPVKSPSEGGLRISFSLKSVVQLSIGLLVGEALA